MSQVHPLITKLTVALVTIDLEGQKLQEARENYFRHEYTLDYYLSTFYKAMIVIMDGITSIPKSNKLIGSGRRCWIKCQRSVSSGN
jgi:Enoyl-CoA hydratase/isomerase